jgi:carotenoid phi-ring synthase / carotenoid chi-ring synthase
MQPASPFHVAVVGGGLAGVAAAVSLAEGGARVTLIEREPQLGGRLRAWTDTLHDGSPFEMDRGFHAFFRHYDNLRALLRRIDPALSLLTPVADYPILSHDLPRVSFSDLPQNPFLALVSLVRRTPSLTLKALAQIPTGAALEMARFDPARTYARFDHLTAREYLDSLRFPPAARAMLFEVFAHSFFNPEDQYSAAEMLMMFHYYFIGNPKGLLFDVVDGAFGERLWQPFQAHLTSLGVDVRCNTSLDKLTLDAARASRWRLDLEGDAAPLDADAVVLATTANALQGIVSRSPSLNDPAWRQQVASLQMTSPFAVWRLWLDKPTNPGRAPFAGTAGCDWLDNISLYHLFHGPSRVWATRSGGSVVELHAYGLPPDAEESDIRHNLLDNLHRFYPETASARALHEVFLLRQDCPAFAPSSHAARPTPHTPWSSLALAGDFTKLPFPSALMERATTSGFIAANLLHRHWRGRGAHQTPISTPPKRGLLARLPF